MLQVNELRKTKKAALIKQFNELDKEIATEKFNIAARRSEKTAQLRVKKKDLARIATVINELKLIEHLDTSDTSEK